MTKEKQQFHGSDLEKIEKVYGIRAEMITSFSANVNPLGISPKLKQTLCSRIDAITSYPDRDYTLLRTSIGTYINLPKDYVMVGNGVTELISLFIQIKSPKHALLVNPTYSEYERELHLVHGTLDYYRLKEENDFRFDASDLIKNLTSDLDLLILCNPNNPTSSAIDVPSLRNVVKRCEELDIFVLVDETYIEFVNDICHITAIKLVKDHPNLLVLRGVSKFFAAPGLRLGYAATSNMELIQEINERRNPWTINSLAAVAGEIMFSDTQYIQATKDLIQTERIRIYNQLKANPNLKVYEPTANFVLVRILPSKISAHDLFDTAIKKGLMIRDCSSFLGLNNQYFRFCFMAPEKNDALVNVINQVCSTNPL